ncbi:MAG: sigma-54-dependent transcriptional regulator [Pseudomonadales bacterium]
MKPILVVEDETVIRTALKRLLERNDYKVREAGSVTEAMNKHSLSDFSLIISDLRLPGAPGTDLIRPAGNTPVLIMTSYASLKSAVDSMKMGAVDYIAKPFDHDDMLGAVTRIIANNKADQQQQPTQPGTPISGIIGRCASMKKLQKGIHKIAPTDSTVLVLGETGTGKELVAKAIHAESRRSTKPIVCVNCAAIPETLIESELFGYEKGAFTGANTNRSGLIEAADGGTLFLDEIGELPLEAQARLLRFIQEGEIRRIGSTESIKVNVRLISATHRDLESLAMQSKFRQDLFYRINVLSLKLPPLRERGKDVLDLAESIISSKAETLGLAKRALAPEAVQAVMTYNWPGNVRELENAIERALILSETEQINIEALGIDMQLIETRPQQDIDDLAPNKSRKVAQIKNDPTEDLSLEDYFQHFILEHQEYMSETELAQKLGVSRKCLWERRQRFGIPRKKSAASSQNQ